MPAPVPTPPPVQQQPEPKPEPKKKKTKCFGLCTVNEEPLSQPAQRPVTQRQPKVVADL